MRSSIYATECGLMLSTDDFRFNAHHLLLDLDATTNHLMMLVVSSEISGVRWEEAVARERRAYTAWISILPGIQIDPMPVLDGRATDADNPTVD
jgi:hypothetical protein